VTEAKRQLFHEYYGSLFIAFVIAGISMIPFWFAFGPLNALMVAIFSALVFGNSFFVLGLVHSRIRMKRFAHNVLVQTGLTLLTLLICLTAVLWIAQALGHRLSPFHPQVLRDLTAVLKGPMITILAPAGFVGVMLINACFQVNRKLGPGVLWNWITGHYYSPREEERIFMFLDMKSSTTLAEQLGNLKFSALVRDFFRDLTFPLLETKGQVSTYVGDEAVISWKPEQGLKDSNCIQLFYKMRAAIETRAAHYEAEYGLLPEFKAGLHIGKVVATEVGEVKSEIVYHGDVLNTAARIQSICNAECCALLISSDLAHRLSLPNTLHMRSLGEHMLKGKEHAIEIFAVNEGPDQNVVWEFCAED